MDSTFPIEYDEKSGRYLCYFMFFFSVKSLAQKIARTGKEIMKLKDQNKIVSSIERKKKKEEIRMVNI